MQKIPNGYTHLEPVFTFHENGKIKSHRFRNLLGIFVGEEKHFDERGFLVEKAKHDDLGNMLELTRYDAEGRVSYKKTCIG